MDGNIIWVGIDAHKKTLAVAIVASGPTPEELTIDNTGAAVRKLARRLVRQGKGREIRACYEAGTCGYTLPRRFEAAGVVCEVIAPSLIPRKPGERLKSDRREAERRLSGRYSRLAARGKNPNKVVIAIARELVGFLWAALRDPQSQTSSQTISRVERGPRCKARQEKHAT